MEDICNEALKNRYRNKKVYEANPLAEATKEMDLTDGRIFFMGLAELNPKLPGSKFYDDIDKVIFLETREVISLFGGNKFYYTKLKDSVKKLTSMAINLCDDGEEKITSIPIFKKVQFDKTIGGLLIEFNKEIKPFILDLANRGYTAIRAADIFSLSSMYAIRLLELMYRDKGTIKKYGKPYITRSFEIEEIKKLLNVNENKYKNTASNFIRRVIKPAVGDINNHTNNRLTFDTVKKGRYIRSITFYMSILDEEQYPVLKPRQVTHRESTNTSRNTLSSIQKESLLILQEYGMGKVIARRIVKAYDYNYIKKAIYYCTIMQKTQAAYIRSVVENPDWFMDIEVPEDFNPHMVPFDQIAEPEAEAVEPENSMISKEDTIDTEPVNDVWQAKEPQQPEHSSEPNTAGKAGQDEQIYKIIYKLRREYNSIDEALNNIPELVRKMAEKRGVDIDDIALQVELDYVP